MFLGGEEWKSPSLGRGSSGPE